MYLCFGDDSVNEGIIAYIAIGIKDYNIHPFIENFNYLKKELGISKYYTLHAKDLFNASRRESNDFISHLNIEQVKTLCNSIINLCIFYKMPRSILSYAFKKDFPMSTTKTKKPYIKFSLDSVRFCEK